MNARNVRRKIWTQMHNVERLSIYYSRRSEELVKFQNIITLGVTLSLAAVLGLYQLSGSPTEPEDLVFSFIVDFAGVAAPVLLFVTGLVEVVIIHLKIGEDIKAAKIKASLAGEVSFQWRRLWDDQYRHDVVQQIELLDRMTHQITAESIWNRKHKGVNRLDERSAEEAKHALAIEFGG